MVSSSTAVQIQGVQAAVAVQSQEQVARRCGVLALVVELGEQFGEQEEQRHLQGDRRDQGEVVDHALADRVVADRTDDLQTERHHRRTGRERRRDEARRQQGVGPEGRPVFAEYRNAVTVWIEIAQKIASSTHGK